MSYPFIFLLAAVFLFIWTVTSYLLWRINQRTKAQRSGETVQPALRLAEQWINESHGKMENLVGRMEQPLSAAQNELLELRLEAGRLPQGIKNIRLVKESFSNPSSGPLTRRGLDEMVRFYLNEKDFKQGEGPLTYLKTSLGEIPCLEMEASGGPLTDERMKSFLTLFHRSKPASGENTVAGGFLYIPDDGQYGNCLANKGWMEGLRTQRLMVVDFKGLSALLMSLRLSKDTENVIETFERGVKTTQSLLGHSDKMGEALAALSANSLRARTHLEGGSAGGFNSPENKREGKE